MNDRDFKPACWEYGEKKTVTKNNWYGRETRINSSWILVHGSYSRTSNHENQFLLNLMRDRIKALAASLNILVSRRGSARPVFAFHCANEVSVMNAVDRELFYSTVDVPTSSTFLQWFLPLSRTQMLASSSDQVPVLSAANKQICDSTYRDHHGLDYAEKCDNECRVERPDFRPKDLAPAVNEMDLLWTWSVDEAFSPKLFVRRESISFKARDSFVVVHSRNEIETTQSTQERKEELAAGERIQKR
ncbi:hypothetical protein EDD85DRAFT_786360 [Armillaria nabsnona]|nr:hypothetical protein EDD85DRAFT_786360 [Armillaria nabsnona]